MGATEPVKVVLPKSAVDGEAGGDIAKQVSNLLQDISLLGTTEELNQAGSFGASLAGPAQSVAVLESGAAALSKVWAAGLGATFVGVWAAITRLWDANPELHETMLWTGTVATAALAISIAAIVSADLRGRATAASTQIAARAQVANAFVHAVEQLTVRPVAPHADGVVVLAGRDPS